MIVGIVGHAQDKFTLETEALARCTILTILSDPIVTSVSSGHCHLGGVDIYTEEIAEWLGLPTHIFPPASRSWDKGYRERNMRIAQVSDIVYSLVVASYPPGYTGMRFSSCYHCGTSNHVKSGGCWTAKYARKLGKPGEVYVITDSGVPSLP